MRFLTGSSSPTIARKQAGQLSQDPADETQHLHRMNEAPKYIDDLMKLPGGSLLIGTLTTNDREGTESSHTVVDGTPRGFRALAAVLRKMADQVETGETESGWGLVLHPDDISGLETLAVDALALGCKPRLDLENLSSGD